MRRAIKLSDKLAIANTFLSLLAIVVSLLVWRNSDTRLTELRDTRLIYYINNEASEEEGYAKYYKHGKSADQGSPTVRRDESDPDVIVIDTIREHVHFTVANAGVLPVKGISITVATNNADLENMPRPEVELKPALDREVIPQGNSLVIRLKNPLGPGADVNVKVTFQTMKNGKEFMPGFKIGEVFVASDVGPASYAPSVKPQPKPQPSQPPNAGALGGPTPCSANAPC